MKFSLLLAEARREFLFNNWGFVLWGLVGSIIPAMILFLKYFDHGVFLKYALYPLIAFPVAGVISAVIIVRHSIRNFSDNPLTQLLSFLWGITSINIVVIAYGFHFLYGKILVGSIFLLIAIAQSTSGFLLKIKPLMVTGVMINLLVWIYFLLISYLPSNDFFSQDSELVLLILVSLVGQLLPGLLLRGGRAR